MFVLAFDRDWTVDVNPHPRREAVPLEWVRYWAHDCEHEVWAIGNQDLVEEANIPGTVESIRRRDGGISVLGEQDELGYYDWWPERDERLYILAELFHSAEEYIVVDDLDLSYVDGWEHYHAWEFVERVRQGDIHLDTPSSASWEADGGIDSADTVREILDDGWVFEITYRDNGDTRTYVATHKDPHRPAMTPIDGPPVFYFETLTGDETHKVRFPDLVDVTPVSAEQLPEPLMAEAATAMQSLIDADESVPLSDITTVLSAAGDTDSAQHSALTLAYAVLQTRGETFEEIGGQVLRILQDSEFAVGRGVMKELIETAQESPEVVAQHTSGLSALATESAYEEGAVRCFVALAEADPAYALDGVPALATAAMAEDEDTRQWAVYALSLVAGSYPEEVYPTTETLIDAMRTENESIRTNALSAVGKITSSYPDAAKSVTADLLHLLDDEHPKVRNNAVGLLGDIAQEHPDVVIEYAEEIADCLDDSNEQARLNASIALLNAGEANPDAIRTQHEQLEVALDDPNPGVRANGCALVANSEAPVPIETLRELRDTDPDETVRDRAEWAVTRIS